MIKRVSKALTEEEIVKLHEIAQTHEFSDGKKTAGKFVRDAKQNLQLTSADKGAKEVNDLVMAALKRNTEFKNLTFPRRIVPFRLNLYEEGMEYGWHVDDPIIPGNDLVRSDFSITVFLSDPSTYDGGELALQTAAGEARIKLNPGDAVVYTTTMLHRVLPVTRGRRLAAVTWIQSMIRDPSDREILYDLRAVLEVTAKSAPGSEEQRLLMRAYSNLVKRWAEV